MYRCNDCLNVFDEPKDVTTYCETGTAYKLPCRETLCPECNSDDIDEVVVCDECDKSININSTNEYADDKGIIICRDCSLEYLKELIDSGRI